MLTRARSRAGLLWSLLALVVQFMLGMAVNLFATIPPEAPWRGPAPEYFAGVVRSVSGTITDG